MQKTVPAIHPQFYWIHKKEWDWDGGKQNEVLSLQNRKQQILHNCKKYPAPVLSLSASLEIGDVGSRRDGKSKEIFSRSEK